MVPALTNNDSITSHNLRRHTDPPWLWTVVYIGSVSLHLLVFWLMRSSDDFQAWFPQSNQSSIPIDFIEIPSEPKATIKPQLTNSKIKPESSFSALPKSALVTPNNQDDGEITSRINLPEEDKTQKREVRKTEPEKSKVRNTEVRKTEPEKSEVRKFEVEKTEPKKPEPEKPEPEKLPVRQQSYPTNPIPEATPIIPESELPWNRRQEVKLGEGTLLPQDIPTDSPTPTAEPSANPNPEPSPSPKVGGAIATVSPILKEEVSELIQQKQLIADALPDVLAEYKGSIEKELEASILPSDEVLKPANILASLIIDKNGQFQQAIVITIEPNALRSQTNIYEQALNEMFVQESFLAAYNQDGSKPDLSNLYIRLKIKPINSQ